MNFEDQITDYASQKHGSEEPAQSAPDAVIVQEPVVEPIAPIEQPTEIVEAPVIAEIEKPVVENAPLPDYDSYIKEISGGVFENVESFKGALPKVQEYDSLAQVKAELEGKVKTMFTPTNDYVKTLNDLFANGATPDQIKSYQRLNEVGDLTKLSPLEIKVHKMVHDGFNEDIARQIVKDDFPIEEFEEDSIERQKLEEKLRVSSIKDLKDLQDKVKDFSTFGTEKLQAQEEQRLQSIALEENHKKEVLTVVPKIAEALTGLGEQNLNGGEGDKAITLKFDYNADFKKEIPKLLTEFFVDYKLPVTADNITKAQHYVEALYWDANRSQLLQMAAKHVEAVTEERVQNKYENRSGLPKEAVNATVQNVNAERSNFLHSVANGGN